MTKMKASTPMESVAKNGRLWGDEGLSAQAAWHGRYHTATVALLFPAASATAAASIRIAVVASVALCRFLCNDLTYVCG